MPVFYTRSNISMCSVNASVGGKTVQSDAVDCNINNIMSRYRSTGVLPLNVLRNKQGIYADVSEYGDYKDCVMRVEAAKRQFMSMPSEIRDRFRNDPGLFLAFASDPSNAQELIDLGLAELHVDPVASAESKRSQRASKSAARGAAAVEPPHSAADDAPGEPGA